MDIKERIAGLPQKWPQHSDYSSRVLQRRFIGGGDERDQAVSEDRLAFVLARLALLQDAATRLNKALDAIPVGRYSPAEIQAYMNGLAQPVFDLRAVLAALEVPK